MSSFYQGGKLGNRFWQKLTSCLRLAQIFENQNQISQKKSGDSEDCKMMYVRSWIVWSERGPVNFVNTTIENQCENRNCLSFSQKTHQNKVRGYTPHYVLSTWELFLIRRALQNMEHIFGGVIQSDWFLLDFKNSKNVFVYPLTRHEP